MRIETFNHVLLNASTIRVDAPDEYVIRVIATGLDHKGDLLPVTLKLTRNELAAINRVAERVPAK
jgi:hypothetical protein